MPFPSDPVNQTAPSIRDRLQEALSPYISSLDPARRAAQIAYLTGSELIRGTQITNSNNPNLDQSSYDFVSRAFPIDLGSDQNNHYMVFNINIPVTRDDNSVRGAYYGIDNYEGRSFVSTELRNDYSKVDNLRFNPNVLGFNNLRDTRGQAIGGRAAEAFSTTRSTRRIKESIALYMPAPMVFTHNNVYEDVSLTSVMGQAGRLGTGVAQGLAAGIAGFALDSARRARQGNNAVGNLSNASTGGLLGTAFAIAGYPISPRIEVLFSNTLQRQFNFEFLLAPRNVEESKAMENIIRAFRFHSAPEIESIDVGISIPSFIPPAEFDITFYQGGRENLSIPRINTCALERIEVDYAPTSGAWATFSNGFPVAARLSLSFRELEIVHKRRVVQGF